MMVNRRQGTGLRRNRVAGPASKCSLVSLLDHFPTSNRIPPLPISPSCRPTRYPPIRPSVSGLSSDHHRGWFCPDPDRRPLTLVLGSESPTAHQLMAAFTQHTF